MLNPNEKVWSEDEERIENYLLGRLNEQEKTLLEQRLRTDEDLRKSVELSAMILAGIRQKGREDLKARLKDQLKGTSSLTSNGSSQDKNLFLYSGIKIAAAIIAAIGVSFLIYRLMTSNPGVPQATDESQKEMKNENVDLPKNGPVADKDDKKDLEKITGKKSTSVNNKPSVLSAPSEEIPAKRNQRLKGESLKYMKPNELVVTLTVEKEKKSLETKLLFKNPSDLTVMNIQETQMEQDGRLEWFYVYYDNRILSLYIDNIKYLSVFKNSALSETPGHLQMTVGALQYSIDLTSKDKFKKAVLRKSK